MSTSISCHVDNALLRNLPASLVQSLDIITDTVDTVKRCLKSEYYVIKHFSKRGKETSYVGAKFINQTRDMEFPAEYWKIKKKSPKMYTPFNKC